MARRRFADDDEDDGWRDSDGDDESWRDGPDDDEPDFGADDEDEPTIRCPHCRREIHEDAAICPHCRNWTSKEDAPPATKPWWLVGGVAACLYVIYRWIVS